MGISYSTIMMSEAPWSKAKIIRSKKEAEGLHLIELEVPSSSKDLYKIPGQYIQLKINPEAKPGFYAIASPPGAETFSLIVKETESNYPFTRAAEGSIFDISTPMGKGFSFQEYFDKYKFDFPTTSVLFMACGSGIAPIVAAIESNMLGLKQTAYNSLFERQGLLYIGAKTEAHLPFKARYQAWGDLGVKVIPVLSRPGEAWGGRTGYIQDALKADGVNVPRNTGALLCGQRGMTDDVKQMLLENGVFEGRILLNF